MIEIRGDNEFFDVAVNSEYDSNLNNYQGGDKIVVNIAPGYKLTQLETEIQNLKLEIDELKNKEINEEILRENNPALKDAYDQYKVVFKLVKKAQEAEREINGN